MRYISEKDIAKAGIVALLENAGPEGLGRTKLGQFMPGDTFHYSWLHSKPPRRGGETIPNHYKSPKRVVDEAIDELLRDKIIQPIKTLYSSVPLLSVADTDAARSIRREVDKYLSGNNVEKQRKLVATIGIFTALALEESLATGQIRQAMRGKYSEKILNPSGPTTGKLYTDIHQTLRDMTKQGLLTFETVHNSNAFKRFSITPKGRRTLQKYAEDPDTKPICEKFSYTPTAITVRTDHKQVLNESQATQTAAQSALETQTAAPYISAFEAAKEFKAGGLRADPRELHGIILAMEEEKSPHVQRIPTAGGATTALIERPALGELKTRYMQQQSERARQ